MPLSVPQSLVASCTLAVLAATFASLSMSGCDLVNKPSELEREIATEQAAIKAYSAKVADVDVLQKKFVAAWKDANEHKNISHYRGDLKTRVMPALDSYLASLDAMPTESAALKEIHAILRNAYSKVRDDFVAYADAVNEDNVEARYKQILAAVDQVGKSRADYLERLTAYYAKNRVDLVRRPQ